MMETRIAALGVAVVAALAIMATGCGGGAEAPSADAPSQPADKAAPAAPAAAGPTLSMGTGSVTGTIKFEGAAPTMKPIKMDADPGCAMKHDTTVVSEKLVLGAGNTVGNILVTVKSGLPAGSWAVPAEPLVIDQRGCVYIPHVSASMAGQTIKFLNSDGVLHNVHALPKQNKEFNKAMPATVTESEHVFSKAEGVFEIKCDVHPWMKAYVAVLNHPFHAVTGKDGTFSIQGLPDGTYEIEAWHEVMGTKTATVTITGGSVATADFTFSTPSRG